jgi:hypothetical protein
MISTEATLQRAHEEPSPAPVTSQQGPSRPPVAAGRFLFGSLSLYAATAVFEAIGTRLAAFTEAMQRIAPPTNALNKILDEIRIDIRRGSKRAYREASHAAIQAAEQRARRTPPRKPAWLVRRAPWSQYWCTYISRGRRRTRDWA